MGSPTPTIILNRLIATISHDRATLVPRHAYVLAFGVSSTFGVAKCFLSLILATNQAFREIDAAHVFDTGHLAICATSEQCSLLFAVGLFEKRRCC